MSKIWRRWKSKFNCYEYCDEQEIALGTAQPRAEDGWEEFELISRPAATAPAGGVTDFQAIDDLGPLREGWRVVVEDGRNGPGVYAYYKDKHHEHDKEDCAFIAPVAALTTAARAAEPAIHLGAEGQKVFAETLLNPPPPTAAFLKAEESYSNLVRPEAAAPAVGVTDSWKEEQARFFGVAVGEVPDSPQPPTDTGKQ